MTDNSEFGSKCLTNASGNFLGCKIDQSLTVTQGIMGFINTVDTVDDPILERQVDKAKWFAEVGSAGPAIIAGTMMIIYRIAMALFIGFAPIFILCLLFKKTAPLFQKWLFYGLATIFSSVLLGVMSEIATDLVANVAGTLFVADKLLTFAGGAGVNGIMEASTQQLGLGLILSTLLITVPPMAGLWFNGMMGNYSAWNTMSGWNGSSQSAPPGIAGSNAYQQQVEDKVHHQYKQTGQNYGNDNVNLNAVKQSQFTTGGYSNNTVQPESIKQNSQRGNAAVSTVNTVTQIDKENISSMNNPKTQQGEKS